MRGIKGLSICLVLLGCLTMPVIRSLAAEANRAADEKAIRTAAAQYIAALNQGDIKAALAHWTTEGDIVDDSGRRSTARERLERDLAGVSETETDEPADSEQTTPTTSIRFLGPDTAIEDGQYGQGDRFSSVWIRQNGTWLLSSLREACIRNQPATELSELDGLAGTWSGEIDGTSYVIQAQWNEAKTYLLRKLTATHNGTVLMSAEQRIGIDPEDGQLKSWIHDADGGHAEGFWSQQGESWIVESRGVTGEGEDVRGKSIYTPEGTDLLRWQSLDNWRGGRAMLDFEVTLTRSAENKS